MHVTVSSFGFKYGAPEECNFLCDVRFLPNPYWEFRLRPFSGLEPEVSAYVLESPEGKAFLQVLQPLIVQMVEGNRAAGKEGLHIAIGCTGGRHRSVAVAEALGQILQDMPVKLTILHRDIERDRK